MPAHTHLKHLIVSDLGMTLILVFLALAAVISAFLAGTAYRQQQSLLHYVEATKSRPVTGAVLKTNFGDIEVSFDTPAVAAKDNFIKLVRENFYTGQRFHRIVKDFAIQTGDPLSRDTASAAAWGTGGPDYTLPTEVSSTESMPAGAVVAVSKDGQSHASQFMILVADSPWLAGLNTHFATVTSGLEVARTISNLATGVTGIPATEVLLLDIQLK